MKALFLDPSTAAPGQTGPRIAIYYKSGGLYVKAPGSPEVLITQTLVDAWTTGDVKLALKTVADPGWVLCDDGTIGSAASGATSRANADAEDLFVHLWNIIDNAYAPVSSGRGASGAADFAANKTLGLTKMLGRALAISGAGAGLTARDLGSTYGVEGVSLTAAQNGVHTHVQNAHTHTQNAHSHTIPADEEGAGQNSAEFAGGVPSGITTSSVAATNQNTTATNQNSGSGAVHENVPPETFLNAMIKL